MPARTTIKGALFIQEKIAEFSRIGLKAVARRLNLLEDPEVLELLRRRAR